MTGAKKIIMQGIYLDICIPEENNQRYLDNKSKKTHFKEFEMKNSKVSQINLYFFK